MKRGYYAYNNDDDLSGLAIVASSARAAKMIAWKSGEFVYGDTSWLDIHVRWVRHAAVETLPVGVINDAHTALILGIYSFLMECPCDECGEALDLVCYHGRALCSGCIEEAIRCSE